MGALDATNEDIRHLDDGLPADIARLKDAGELGHAVRLIEEELAAGTRPELAPCLRAERARMLRTPLDYSVTREQALAQIRAEWPEFGETDLDALIDRGRIDWRLVEGEQRFLASFLDALRKYPEEVPGLSCPKPDRTAQLATIAEMRRRGHVARRVRIRASVEAGEGIEIGPETLVRCWLPLPAACPQQADIRVVDATSGGVVAAEDVPQRTFYWEQAGQRSFFVEYEYAICAPYANLWGDEPTAPSPRIGTAPAPCIADLQEDRPHIAFTPYLRALADRIFASLAEDDALGRARAAYDYVTKNVDYRFQPAYVLLDGIADNCAKSLRGDCGVFALTFITLCRLGGVPARWQSGLYAAPDHVGPHDWAMFYVAGLGWLWADCSFGSAARRDGDEARRRFYFGNLEPWRMVANAQFEGPLAPACDVLRNDPFDNQVGEMVVDGRGLTSHDFVWKTELVSMEPAE